MVNPPINARRALVTRQAGASPIVKELIKAGVADREQIAKALQICRDQGRPLPKVLEEITGQKLPEQVIRQCKRQQLFELKVLYGVESLDPDLNSISFSQL
ncbi:MAG: hypothetical protein Q6J33_01095, partial [Gloeomargarita sp. DG_2_bins_126]